MARSAIVLGGFATCLSFFVGSLAAEPAPPAAVDMFDAVAAGTLEVKVIPKDATRANILFRNQTKQPLHLRLPEAFAGVPVLAQRGGGLGGGGLGGGGLGGAGGAQQSFGGGFGGGGLGGGGGFGGGGFFQVPPEAMKKVRVVTVCLEHGKKDPNPRIAYELKPITDFTRDKRVIEICKLLGQGKLNQQTAQAATWHLTDGLSFEQLVRKVRIRHLNGSTEMFFSPGQVAQAARLVASVTEYVDSQQDVSPGRVATLESPGDFIGP